MRDGAVDAGMLCAAELTTDCCNGSADIAAAVELWLASKELGRTKYGLISPHGRALIFPPPLCFVLVMAAYAKIREAYVSLGLQEGCTLEDVKTNYKQAALRTHPDKNPDNPQATAEFQRVGEAYHILTKHLGEPTRGSGGLFDYDSDGNEYFDSDDEYFDLPPEFYL
ncbi:hypothetical protein EST38_g8527 [Candolleomyces aberdarensis]|uniref:J domain-containing protein n=1 Tax=Candolleomyces aberdarensis TaxID=2316362 RepID=A0A4Q2DF64_9AGAR|nr:hypothetical protein EST38_g8527 [Candolleomyces aberdarensis]